MAVVGLIYSFNLVIFVAIVYSILSHSGKLKTDKAKSSFKRTAILAAILFIMFGLGWFVGLLGTSSLPEEVFIPAQIIFTIIVGLQGFFIFVLHVLRSPDARKQWKRWFSYVTFQRKLRDGRLNESHHQHGPHHGTMSLQRPRSDTMTSDTLRRPTSSTNVYDSDTLRRSVESITGHAAVISMSLPTLEEDAEIIDVEEDMLYRNRYAEETFTWSEQTENDTETTETVFFNFEAIED